MQHDFTPQRRLFDQGSRREQAREIEQRDRLGRVAAGFDHRLGERHRPGEARWQPARVDSLEPLFGLGLVAERIGERAADQWNFARRNGAALEQADDVARLSAAEEIDDDRVGFALRLPDVGLGGDDRRADGGDPLRLAGIGRLVAGGDARLQRLEIEGQLGDRRLRRRGSAERQPGDDRRRRERAGETRRGHGLAPLSRISMRRFSAENGWAGSRRRLSA